MIIRPYFLFLPEICKGQYRKSTPSFPILIWCSTSEPPKHCTGTSTVWTSQTTKSGITFASASGCLICYWR